MVYAAVFGFLAGMAADLDVFIRSDDDPLLFLEYHRQFTHSLVFVPVAGAVAGLLLYALFGKRRKVTVQQCILYCSLGYATHGLLDACTSYGTQLFWPFSDVRIAWNAVSVVDPLFTLPILILLVLAIFKKRQGWARAALVWGVVYLSFGVYQRDVAEDMGRNLARERGHTVLRIEAKPSFANLLVWKSVYETRDRFFVDAVRTGLTKKVYEGASVARLNISKDFEWLDPTSQQASDIERFRRFSNGYIAQDPSHPDRIIDVRYSLLPNEIAALWSIELFSSAGPQDHVGFLTVRERVSEKSKQLWQMVLGHEIKN